MKVEFDGKFTVSYVNSEGQESAFRCTPDVGRLFAAAPMLLKTCATALHVLDTCSCDDMSKLAADNIRAAIAAAEGE